jgi:glycosyltransferase involved in cell wall biosynthesis
VSRRARLAQAIVAYTEHTRAEIVDVLGVPAERITAIPPGVDPLFAPGASREALLRERFGIDRPYVLCVGTLEPRKNLHRALSAVEGARLGDDVALVIAGGSGWRNNAFEAELARSTVPVTLAGAVSDPELVELYRGARCLLFPSLFEGYGLPPLEAMACGCPVITSDRSTLPDVVGDAGLLVDPLDVEQMGEAVRAVVADADMRGRMRERGLARAAEQTWERAADRTLAVLRRVSACGS